MKIDTTVYKYVIKFSHNASSSFLSYMLLAAIVFSLFFANISYACKTGQCHNNDDSYCESYCDQNGYTNPDCQTGSSSCEDACCCTAPENYPRCTGDYIADGKGCGTITNEGQTTCDQSFTWGSDGPGSQCYWNNGECTNEGSTCYAQSTCS